MKPKSGRQQHLRFELREKFAAGDWLADNVRGFRRGLCAGGNGIRGLDRKLQNVQRQKGTGESLLTLVRRRVVFRCRSERRDKTSARHWSWARKNQTSCWSTGWC